MCPIHEWKLETISLPFLVKTLSDNDPSWTYGEDYSVVTELPKATWISEGKGYASKIYSVQIPVGSNTHSIVIKILRTSTQLGQKGSNRDCATNNQDKNVEHSKMLALAHNREFDFYTKASACELMKIPKFISGQKVECGKQGFLIMEDLSTRAKSDFNVARGLTVEQAKSLIEQMCILQIQSLGIADLEKNFCQIDLVIGAVTKYSRSCVEIIASKKYEWFDARRAKEVLSWTSADQFSLIISAKKEFEVLPVLVHQDLWPGNILWEISKNQTEDHTSDDRMLAIVDWQCCHAGSFTSDLAAIIGVNCSGCFRREHESELLDFYIQRMSEQSQLSSQARNIRLNKSNVSASYKISLKCAVLQMAMTLVTNSTQDQIPPNESEGPLTLRFRQLVEDIFVE